MAPFEPKTVTSNRSKRRYFGFAIVFFVVLIILYTAQHSSTSSAFRTPWQGSSDLASDSKASQSQGTKPTRPKNQDNRPLTPQEQAGYVHPNQSSYTTSIVMGRMDKDALKVEWVHQNLINITDHFIYIVDDPNSTEPHLTKNHGREGMVYIQYIVEHYDDLNDITFFWHTDDKVWHNNLLLAESSVRTINTMNREQIIEEGYVPSRCDHWPGCPSWVIFNPSQAEHNLDFHKNSDMFNSGEFGRMFPGEDDFPRYFAETCCSQFAVSREAIRAVPKIEYERVREWIHNYESDQLSGRALEMMWQYLFLRKGTLCPSMTSCYCRTYGVCIEDRKEVTMLERWNEFRTRAEEMNYQRQKREGELIEKGWEFNGKKPFKDDWEWDRIQREEEVVKDRFKAYSAMIDHHWDLPPSEAQWW